MSIYFHDLYKFYMSHIHALVGMLRTINGPLLVPLISISALWEIPAHQCQSLNSWNSWILDHNVLHAWFPHEISIITISDKTKSSKIFFYAGKLPHTVVWIHIKIWKQTSIFKYIDTFTPWKCSANLLMKHPHLIDVIILCSLFSLTNISFSRITARFCSIMVLRLTKFALLS